MATGLTAKLIKGARTLDLNSGRYKIGEMFAPPGVALTPLMAGGTSANRRAGATKRGETASNRAYAFPVHIANVGSQAEIARAVADLSNFLALAGDEDEPLYLYFKPNANVAAMPLWGQDGYYYEIAHAETPELDPRSMYLFLSGQGYPIVTVSCQIKPYAQGKFQALGSAIGGVLEDTLGAVDGQSRGLMIPNTVVNKFTNPIFGHATFGNGWSAGADVTATANTNPDFVLFGRVSAKLVSVGATSTYTQSIDTDSVATHQLFCYAKRPDGAAVTSSDIVLYYNTSLTGATYVSIGDGWYLVYKAVTGIDAATATGCAVPAGRTVFVDGFNLTETAFITPPVHGDMLGCSWSGTVHASTSTRVSARLRLAVDDTVINRGQGTIRVVWRPLIAPADYGAEVAMLFDDANSNLRLFFTGSDDKLNLEDGTNTVSSAAQTWSALDEIVLHAVWGPGQLVLYKDGASIASGSSFTPPALGAYLYIGINSAGAQHAFGTLMDFTIFGQALTATEVLADYNNIVQVAADGQLVSAIPYLWTKDGDNIIDAYYDGTAVNAFVCAGIPGSAPASTSLKITGSAALSTLRSIWLGRLAAESYIPVSTFFADQLGTATTAADVGSAVETVSVTTSLATSIALSIPTRFYHLFQGNEFYLFARLSTASGTGLRITQAQVATAGGVTAIYPDEAAVTADGTRRLVKTPPLILRRQKNLYEPSRDVTVAADVALYMLLTGGTADVLVDYVALLPAPLTQLNFPYTTAETIAFVQGRDIQVAATSGEALEELAFVYLDELELEPGLINHVVCGITDPAATATITLTFTVNTLLVRPRWALL